MRSNQLRLFGVLLAVLALAATVLTLVAPNPAAAQAAADGQIFIDFDRDGTIDAGEVVPANDPLYPPGGVQVDAYDANGQTDACTVTGNSYSCDFDGLSGTDFRLQFSISSADAAAGWSGTIRGADSKSSVQFVSDGDSAAWGITPPSKCPDDGVGVEGNANVQAGKLWGTCFVNGSADNGIAPDDSIVAVNADNSGIIEHLATKDQVGSVWGLAYNEWDSVLFTSAFVKRHVGLGPEGADGLYWSNYPSTTWSGISLESLGGPSFGDVTGRDLGDPTQATFDVDAFAKVGKTGIGDIDVTPDGRTLLVSNLAANTVQVYDVSGVAGGGDPVFIEAIDNLDPGCADGDYQVYGIKTLDSASAYVGVTCTAETSVDPTDLDVNVVALDLTTGASSTVLTVPMSYVRPCAGAATSGVPIPVGSTTCDAVTANGETIVDSTFLPWSDDFADYGIKENSTIDVIRPQPLLTDIEVRDDGGLVIGVMDRSSHQIGNRAYKPDPTESDQTLVKTILAGEILRVCNTSTDPAAPTFVIEGSSADCGVNFIDPTGGDSSDGNFRSGPLTNGEFYDDSYGNAERGTPHGENHSGGLYVRPYQDQIVHSAMDPDSFGAGGLDWLSDSDGSQQLARDFYSGNPEGSFAKAGGVGDVEGCFVPIEIGDFVWLDLNGNGIQDPGELPLEGVTVTLNDSAGNPIASTVTDAEGNYTFNSSVLTSDTSYTIEFDVSTNVTPLPNGATNADLEETLANAGSDTLADSNLENGVIAVDTEAPGVNNHSYDAGFALPEPPMPSIAIDKSVDRPSVPSGAFVTFTIIVTNDGNLPLTDVTVTDSQYPQCDNVIPALAVDESAGLRRPAADRRGRRLCRCVVPVDRHRQVSRPAVGHLRHHGHLHDRRDERRRASAHRRHRYRQQVPAVRQRHPGARRRRITSAPTRPMMTTPRSSCRRCSTS